MSIGEPAVSRLRITYAVDEPLCYTSVLDMGRHWERMVRRARLPLAYTQGYHPHPRLLFAAPLPVGYRATQELLDLYVLHAVESTEASAALELQSPRGLEIGAVESVDLSGPVLQSIVLEAEYAVELWSPASPADVQRSLAAFMERAEVVRQRERKGRQQTYDLRALFSEAGYVDDRSEPAQTGNNRHVLHIRARCGSSGSGRPEELIEELGIPSVHVRITRTRLIWQEQDEKEAA
ncbi:MAG: TIGR03936 family radical SAM-associated protein [Anaerolineae bacterium]